MAMINYALSVRLNSNGILLLRVYPFTWQFCFILYVIVVVVILIVIVIMFVVVVFVVVVSSGNNQYASFNRIVKLCELCYD